MMSAILSALVAVTLKTHAQLEINSWEYKSLYLKDNKVHVRKSMTINVGKSVIFKESSKYE